MILRNTIGLVLGLSTVCALAEQQGEPPRPDLDQLVRSSSVVFSGRVKSLGAATLPEVPVDDATAVVAVEQDYTPPGTLGDLTGRDITVQLARSTDLGAGDRAVFFTNSWIYGQGVAVTEVGHLPIEQDPKAISAAITLARENMADEKIQARLSRADLVVEGEVIETRRVEAARQGPISEHSPDWWEAVIRVSTVLKGELASEQLVVLYAASNDEVWIDSPKMERGQQAIWLLQRDQQERGGPRARIEGYTGLDPLDMQSSENLEKIRLLLEDAR